jgi:hypothetical protein
MLPLQAPLGLLRKEVSSFGLIVAEIVGVPDQSLNDYIKRQLSVHFGHPAVLCRDRKPSSVTDIRNELWVSTLVFSVLQTKEGNDKLLFERFFFFLHFEMFPQNWIWNKLRLTLSFLSKSWGSPTISVPSRKSPPFLRGQGIRTDKLKNRTCIIHYIWTCKALSLTCACLCSISIVCRPTEHPHQLICYFTAVLLRWQYWQNLEWISAEKLHIHESAPYFVELNNQQLTLGLLRMDIH